MCDENFEHIILVIISLSFLFFILFIVSLTLYLYLPRLSIIDAWVDTTFWGYFPLIIAYNFIIDRPFPKYMMFDMPLYIFDQDLL